MSNEREAKDWLRDLDLAKDAFDAAKQAIYAQDASANNSHLIIFALGLSQGLLMRAKDLLERKHK